MNLLWLSSFNYLSAVALADIHTFYLMHRCSVCSGCVRPLPGRWFDGEVDGSDRRIWLRASLLLLILESGDLQEDFNAVRVGKYVQIDVWQSAVCDFASQYMLVKRLQRQT